MSEMVERVARAIDPYAWKYREDGTPHNVNPERQAAARQKARAAIAAMREPTDEMCDSGAEAYSDSLDADRAKFDNPQWIAAKLKYRGTAPATWLPPTWQAMIDEALK